MQNEIKEFNDRIDILNRLIEKKDSMLKQINSEPLKQLIKDLEQERLSAISDYMNKNTPLNQAYAKVMTYICNLLELYKNPTELENLLKEKDTLQEELTKVKSFKQTESVETGGSV